VGLLTVILPKPLLDGTTADNASSYTKGRETLHAFASVESNRRCNFKKHFSILHALHTATTPPSAHIFFSELVKFFWFLNQDYEHF
jgi:hypothetical protein